MKRKIRKYGIMLFLISFNLSAIAQHHEERSKSIALHTISNQNNTADIASITVVSNVSDSTFLGIAPSGESNVRANLIVDSSGIQGWLQAFVEQQYGSRFKTNGTKLKWVINALSIGTDSDSVAVFSYAKINADIYSATGNNNFQLSGNFDTLIINQNPNPDFGESIATAINTLYNNSVSNTELTPVKGDVSANALASSAQSGIPKILSDSIHPTGIYVSYQEFLNDAPSVPVFYVGVDGNTHQVTLYRLASDSAQIAVPEAWGLSIHNELYHLQDGQLYPIERNGGGFSLSKYLDYRTRKNQAEFWRNAVGRRQGDTNPYNDKHIYRVAVNANGTTYNIETTHLDMRTGKLTF